MLGIGIDGPDNYLFDSRIDDRACARRGPAISAARLQSHIERRAFDLGAGFVRISNRLDFRVRFPGAAMPSAADNLSLLHQHRPDHWIRRGLSVTPPRQVQRQLHETEMVHWPDPICGRQAAQISCRESKLPCATDTV